MNDKHTLSQLVDEINPLLTTASLNRVYSPSKGVIEIAFLANEERFSLIVTKKYQFFTAFLVLQKNIPRKDIVCFFEHQYDTLCDGISLYKNDRVLVLSFDNASLMIPVFGAHPNVFYVIDGIIQDVIKGKKRFVGMFFEDWLGFSFQKGIPQTPIDYFFDSLGSLPKAMVKELASLHHVESKTMDEVQSMVTVILDQLKNHPSPRLTQNGRFTLLNSEWYPVPTRHDYPSVNEGVRRAFYTLVNEFKFHQEQQQWVQTLEKRSRYLSSVQKKSGDERSIRDKAERYERYGHLLLAHLHEIEEGATLAKVENYFDQSKLIEIPIKPTLTAQENAQRYYEKSKRTLSSLQIQQTMATQAVQEKRQIEEALFELQMCEHNQQLLGWKKKFESVLTSLKSGTKTSENQPMFFEFYIQNYRILVGRNANNNDELLRFSHKTDLWLHAHGVGGSHVIIQANKKPDSVPKNVIQKAASIAAFNSKSKGSALAPVKVTQRKYVRKPKGGKPGQVIVDKEEILMVEPSLPKE